ncbi:MAG: hypothetical protein AAF713_16060 [Pseudomonadota bacterium]
MTVSHMARHRSERRWRTAKRKAVGFLMGELGLSERQSRRIVGLARSVQQYRPVDSNDDAVLERMRVLASENRRHGYLRLLL